VAKKKTPPQQIQCNAMRIGTIRVKNHGNLRFYGSTVVALNDGVHKKMDNESGGFKDLGR
jgi:hypothetical protein